VDLVLKELLTVFSFEKAKKTYSDQGFRSLAEPFGLPGDTPLVREIALAKVRAAYDLYEKRLPAGLRLTHSGRTQLSVLKQALRTGREREPFGILWDVRHWEQDVQIAILDAREGSPLALAYMDMNGLKQINDARGHDVGDLALKTCLQAVASAIGDRGQAYRLGGDEVLAFFPGQGVSAAVQLIELASRKLMAEPLEPAGTHGLFSISAGVIASTDSCASPGDLRKAADKVQYRAKERSKETMPRTSVIAIDGKEEMTVIEHDPGASSLPTGP
jgi:diguanylate cyclase (GGDEF)-like protein